MLKLFLLNWTFNFYAECAIVLLFLSQISQWGIVTPGLAWAQACAFKLCALGSLDLCMIERGVVGLRLHTPYNCPVQ